jgi:hypothetical protein
MLADYQAATPESRRAATLTLVVGFAAIER